MTDNEIIKALECCKDNSFNNFPCEKCPYRGTRRYCANNLCEDALDFITRQKEEIERLKNKAEELSEVLSDTIRIRYAEAKAEAVKEFAMRLEEYSYESMGNYGISHMVVSVKDIDNLVKKYEKGR